MYNFFKIFCQLSWHSLDHFICKKAVSIKTENNFQLNNLNFKHMFNTTLPKPFRRVQESSKQSE